MATTSYLVVLFCATAGQNGNQLGSDEEEIVLIAWLVLDIAKNKVRKVIFCFLLSPINSLNNSTTFSKLALCVCERHTRRPSYANMRVSGIFICRISGATPVRMNHLSNHNHAQTGRDFSKDFK